MVWPFHVADVVDIALVALLLYIFFWWLGRRMSRSALRGVSLVTGFILGLYLLARLFELYMVEQVSQLLIVFVLIATVVIFQSDFRRMLYSAGARLFGQDPAAEQTEASVVDVLVESVSHLAETSTGALIAIRGREPWDHYIQGGIELNGVVSAPLLYSIFDVRTAGHDGAVLLEGRRAKTFAVHLPLTTDLPHESRYGGTRHAAARGLADLCDAFIIVVSEEHGTISVAHEGTIKSVETAADLKEKLSEFWETYYGSASAQDTQWWSWRVFQTAALSVAVSLLLWLSFAYNPGTVYRSFEVPIEYHDVPPNWMLEEGAGTARITLSGPEQAFRILEPNQMAIAFSLESPQDGTTELRVEERNLDLPRQLTLTNATPRTIEVTAHPLRPMTLPVSIGAKGHLPDSLELASLQASPDSASVLVPEGSSYEEIRTEPLVLDSIRTDTTVERSLVLFDDGRFPDDAPRAVKLNVDVQPQPGGNQ